MSENDTTHIAASEGQAVEVGVDRGDLDGKAYVTLTPWGPIELEGEPVGSQGISAAWLRPDEARAVASALNSWADEADARNAELSR